MPVHIEIEKDQKATLFIDTILIQGDSSYYQFETLIHSVKNSPVKIVIVDLEKCMYVDTKVIALIIGLFNTLKKRGGSLEIHHPNAEIKALFEAIQLDKIIYIN